MRLIKLSLLSLTIVGAAVQAEESKPFTMNGEFGLINTTGNTKSTAMLGKLNAHQELEMWSNDYVLEASYKNDEDKKTGKSQTTEQKYFLSGQGNYKLENPDHRIFVFGSYEDNKFSAYDYQATLAAGWSQKVWEDDSSKFEYSVGPGYSFAKQSDGKSANGMILRGSLSYLYKISDTAQFTQSFSTEIGSDNTKSKAVSAVSAKMSEAMSLKFSLTLDHNTDVVAPTKKLDTQTAVTLVYTFL